MKMKFSAFEHAHIYTYISHIEMDLCTDEMKLDDDNETTVGKRTNKTNKEIGRIIQN